MIEAFPKTTCVVSFQHILFPSADPLYVTLAGTLEKEPDDKNLKGAHGCDEEDLDQAEVDDSLLGAADSAEVAVLAGAEVFLVARDGGHLARDLEEGLLEGRGLFGS